MLKESFPPEKYTRTEHTTTFVKANLYAFIYPLPFLIPYVIVYIACRFLLPESLTLRISIPLFDSLLVKYFVFLLLLVVLIILHELVHAAFFLAACEGGRKSVVFGVKQLTPYCHCEEILTLRAFRRSCLAPLWAICLPMAVLSLFVPDIMLFLLTVVMITGSGGDLWIVSALRKYNADTTLVYDRDDVVGCDVYVPADKS